ncbi:MAG: ATP-binding protein [Micrococcales bacterium]|nr:ATP-binding protein [Micrococcales bacterium]
MSPDLARRKLPIGVQTFREIRDEGSYYVDKTGYAAQLVAEGKTYFLSRPRRFGKSLFLDTLAEMFAGNKRLFEGLECYDTWDWDTVYPVVRIDFAERSQRSLEWIDQRIEEILALNEERLGVPATTGTAPARFGALIRNAQAKHGQRVVVLVDEYDKPILDTMTDPDLARDVRDRLASLYGVTKSQDAHIKFVMLTGVSKFSKVNLFSGLNNPEDITLDAEYSAVCGYTEEDLDSVFAPELVGLDRDQVREWYNGYSWGGQSVYNPYDLLLLFRKRQFDTYWFETGTPTFLVDTLTEQGFYLPRLQNLEATAGLLSSVDVGHVSPTALLFQTGYLTVDSTHQTPQGLRYRLRLPNHEVRMALPRTMLSAFSPDAELVREQASRLPDLLEAADFPGIERLFKAHFASIPHDWYRSNTIAQAKGYYCSVFYAFFASAGLETTAEDTSNTGRLDLAVRYAGQVFLFEVKTDAQPPGSAMKQIEARGYAEKYRGEGLPIHLVGVEFSREQRTLTRFQVQTLTD